MECPPLARQGSEESQSDDMKGLRNIQSLVARSPLPLTGLTVGTLALTAAFLVPSLRSGPGMTGVAMVGTCSFGLALVLISGGILDVLVRVIPEYCREAAQLRRLRNGLCLRCGYDLRGSSERCPECGTPFYHRQYDPCDR